MSGNNNFNTRKAKHANFIRQAEEEIARGNVVNTTTNAAAFHAAQSAAAAALGRTPVAELNFPSEFSSNNEEEPQAAPPNGLRQRVIIPQAVANRGLPPRPRRKRSKCCKGSLCTLQGGQRRRKTKRRRNY